MTAVLPLIADVLVKATVLLAAAAALDLAVARRASAAARHLVWSLVMAALVILPVAVGTLPRWEVRIAVPRAAAVAAAEALRPLATAVPASAPATGEAAPAPAVSADAGASFSVAPLFSALVIVYVLGVLLLLTRLFVEPFALRRLTRNATVLHADGWQALFDGCAAEMRVARPVRLLRSAHNVMPLTFGTVAPVIVVPAAADEWDDDRRRTVLLHELAHIARRDCVVQRLAALVCACYWPHPGVWWAARRLRVERELACDDRVLAAGAAARDYAGHLLELAHTLGASPAPATALGMARARQLEQRLLAILDAARNRARVRRRGLAIAVTVSAAVVVSMAALGAAVVPADPDAPPATPSFALAAAGQQAVTGTWELRRTQDPNAFQISIHTGDSSHGRTIRRDRLAGLPVDQIDAVNARVNFPIRREAGTFTVDGVCRTGVCAGTFAFAPDPAFADALVARGIGRPTARDQFALAIADAGLAYVDALAAAGYVKPDVALLVRAAQHGVDFDYLRGMTALGYRTATLDELITLRDHGVDPAYIRGMQAAGYGHLSADDLRRARDHGADPDYARAMAALGFGNLALSDLIQARDHGVDQVYVRDMQALGLRLPLAAYIRTRDHGVDPGYVRGMAALGYTGLDADTLIRMRDHGVDPEFVRRVQRDGAPRLGVDEIIRRRDRGEAAYHDVRVDRLNPVFYAAQVQRMWRALNAWLHS
jgi:beta-lactamase regulating signal transducer with metallopeptidase domain